MRRSGGYVCAVKQCRSMKNKGSMSFFSFPKDIDKAQKWALLCGRNDLVSRLGVIHKTYKVCAGHFERKMFLNYVQSRLKPNAHPTIFPTLKGSSKSFDHTYPVFNLPITEVDVEATPEKTLLGDTTEYNTELLSPTCTASMDINVLQNLLLPTDSQQDMSMFEQHQLLKHEEIDPLEDLESTAQTYLTSQNFSKNVEGWSNTAERLNTDLPYIKLEPCEEKFQSTGLPDEEIPFQPSHVKVEEVEFTENFISGSACTVSGQSLDSPKAETPHKVFSYSKYDYAAAQSTQLPEQSLSVPITSRTTQEAFKCGRCDYYSSKHCNLTRHMRTHTGEKPFNCTLCDYASSNRSHLKAHMRKHTREKPFKCSLCDYTCAEHGHLKKHIRTHTGEKPFKCLLCDYSSANRNHVTSHRRTHTGEKPFRCTLCDYVSAQNSTLAQHMRTHTGYKPFKCTLCDYAGTQKNCLIRHMRTHAGENPIKCTLCDYVGSNSIHLRSHMIKHKKVNSPVFVCS